VVAVVEWLDREAKDSAPPEAKAAEEIRSEIKRIVESADFAMPERARKFLTYIVNETLAGRADRIKAYSIAIEVFGRSASFDAQSDPVVRIEAGRVRRALEHYYLTAGQDDPIIITIPKGGYVPNFTWRNRSLDEAAHIAIDGRAASLTRGRVPRRFWLALAAAEVLVVAVHQPCSAFGGRTTNSCDQHGRQEITNAGRSEIARPAVRGSV
jgi:hypothetical protein